MRSALFATALSAQVAGADVSRYEFLSDSDFFGNDLRAQATKSKEACAELCLSVGGCAAAVWNSPESKYADNACNLKSKAANQKTAKGEIAIRILPKVQNMLIFLDNVDFPGSDISGSKAVDSKEACAELCSSTPGCRAASWNAPGSKYADSTCNLKGKGDDLGYSNGEVGILKLPGDWADGYAAGELLYTPDESSVKYRPEVGNGNMATVVGSDTVFMAGVFNGCLDGCKQSPSHRARIPAPLALEATGGVTAAAVDVRRGQYLRRYDSGVDLSFYAHRQRPSLLIVEVSSDRPASSVSLAGAPGVPASADFAWTTSSRAVAGVELTVWHGEAHEAERADLPKARVAVVFPANLASVQVSESEPAAIVSAFRSSFDGQDPAESAVADWTDAATLSAAELRGSHEAAWAELWESGFEAIGRLDVTRAVKTSMYWILSSVRDDVPFSLSPGGLASNGYDGHSFWDCETWMYPAMVLWHPTIADGLLQYRMQRVQEAKEKASGEGFSGAKFPWQSAYSGSEQTPSWSDDGTHEIHITGDIAIAAQQYWYATRNETWLKEAYPGLLKETADFWLSRVTWDGDVAHIKDVTAPDEYARHVDDSVYTNYAAQRNLIFAIEAAKLLGQESNPDWQRTADALPILFDDAQKRHPEYSGYGGKKIKQGDVVLLGFPLMMNMTQEVRRSDLEYYAGVTDNGGPAMTWAMHAIGYLELGDQANADSNFNRAFANAQPPFGVWSETPTGGAVNFITGAGGFLQAALFGLPGLRIWPEHLALTPNFVSGMESVAVQGIHYRGAVFSLSYDAQQMTLTAAQGSATLDFEDAQGRATVAAGESLQRSLGAATITVDASARVALV